MCLIEKHENQDQRLLGMARWQKMGEEPPQVETGFLTATLALVHPGTTTSCTRCLQTRNASGGREQNFVKTKANQSTTKTRLHKDAHFRICQTLIILSNTFCVKQQLLCCGADKDPIGRQYFTKTYPGNAKYLMVNVVNLS